MWRTSYHHLSCRWCPCSQSFASRKSIPVFVDSCIGVAMSSHNKPNVSPSQLYCSRMSQSFWLSYFNIHFHMLCTWNSSPIQPVKHFNLSDLPLLYKILHEYISTMWVIIGNKNHSFAADCKHNNLGENGRCCGLLQCTLERLPQCRLAECCRWVCNITGAWLEPLCDSGKASTILQVL